MGWVGADLFGGFQPITGLLKRLKIRYTFDGEEATVVRREHELLVLPEDKFLKQQIEECQRQSKLNENQFNFELSRAKEIRDQYSTEKRNALDRVSELEAQLAVFSPLQLEILRLSRDLRQLRREAGPAPVLQNIGPMKPGEDTHGWTTQKLAETEAWTDEYAKWARKFIYSYQEIFAPRVKSVMTSLGSSTGMVVVSLEPYTKDVRPGSDFDELLNILLRFFVQLEATADEREANAALARRDRDTISRYERMPLAEQRAALNNPAVKGFIDEAYDRTNRGAAKQ